MLNIDLAGKVAVVTGAGGELGRAIARTLGRAGADVAVHYLTSAAKAEAVAADIRAMGRRATTFSADVGLRDDVMRLRDHVTRELGDADIVVANAVNQYKWTTVLEQASADYEGQFRSSVLQNVYLAQAFVPAMIRKRSGRIIAINTECTMLCSPNQSAYISGKAGQDRVLRVLAKEVGEHQITVNQVAPGWMISDKDRAAHTEHNAAYESGVPMRRRGEDQDIANAVAFLASDMASFISGAFLSVSGGAVMPAI